MRGVRAPQVRTRSRAVVGVVATGLVDPLPVQVPAEVDVQFAHAAALLRVPATTTRWRPLHQVGTQYLRGGGMPGFPWSLREAVVGVQGSLASAAGLSLQAVGRDHHEDEVRQ